MKVGVPLLAIALLPVLLTTLHVSRMRRLLGDIEAAQAKRTASLVAEVYRSTQDDQQRLDGVLQDVESSMPGIRRIRIYRFQSGELSVWASSHPGEVGQYRPEPPDKNLIGMGYGQSTTDDRMSHNVQPVTVDGTLATVAVQIAPDAQARAIRRAKRETLAVGLGAVGLYLLLLLGAGYGFVVRKTRRLQHAVSRIAEGDLDVRLSDDDPPGRDRLESAAHDLDHMVRTVALRSRQQEAVVGLSMRALAGADLQTLTEEVAWIVARNLDVERSQVLELAQDGERLRVRVAVGWGDDVLGLEVPAGLESDAGYALLYRAPVVIEDLSKENRFRPPPHLVREGIVSGLGVIIPGQDRSYGVLAGYTSTHRAFTADDVHFLQTLAATLGWSMEHRRVEAELSKARAFLEHLIETGPLIMFRIDARTLAPTYASPNGERIFGRPGGNGTVGPAWWAGHVHPDDADEVVSRISRAAAMPAPEVRFQARFRVGSDDLAYRWHDVILRPEVDGTGKLVSLLGYALDADDRLRAEDHLREALAREQRAGERLRALDQMKNTFLQAVSHDLRTPLSVVLSSALTLEGKLGQLPPETSEELVGRISVHSSKLDRILSDLLDVDRLASGSVEPRHQPTAVSSLVRAVVSELELGPHEVLIEDDDLIANVDPTHAERIVENLVLNAVQHSPEGAPVRVEIRRSADGVLIAVEDADPGVPDDLRQEIFEPFRYGRLSAHGQGTGLGLSLVARLAALHGGPGLGRGSTRRRREVLRHARRGGRGPQARPDARGLRAGSRQGSMGP